MNKTLLTVPTLAEAAFWLSFALASFFAIVPLPVHPEDQPSDKVLHMLAFATLATCGHFAFVRLRPVMLAGLLSAYGVLIELVQSIPALHRDAEIMDWVADTVAVIAVLGALQLARRLRGAP